MRKALGGLLALVVTTATAVACAPPPATATIAPPQFASEVVMQTGSLYTGDALVADVTGDGRPDLVLTGERIHDSPQHGRLLVLPQLPDHHLGAARSWPLSFPMAISLAAGDLNGDGRPDVAVATAVSVDIFWGTRTGLSGPTVLPIRALSVSLADLNSDGRLDLVIVNYVDHQIYTALQSSPGHFAPPRPVSGPLKIDYNGGMVKVADLNGDGRPDLVADDEESFWTLLQTSTGGFVVGGRYYTVPVNGTRWSAYSLAVGDVSGDGRPDVVQPTNGNVPTSSLDVFNMSATRTFPAAIRLPSADEPAAVVVADLNGDGRNDVVVGHSNWDEFGIYTQQPDGQLSPEALYPVSSLGPDGGALTVGDLNGDGKPDVVLPGTGEPTIAILYQK